MSDAAADALALHCMMGRGRAWSSVAERLGQRFTAPDLPGHGAAPWDPDTPYPEAALAAARAVWGAERHLVGHSFGAVLCLHLAARYPERVERLTLIEPVLFAAAPWGEARAENATRFDPILADIQAGRLALAAEAFHAVWGSGAWSDLPERIQARMAMAMPIIASQHRFLADDGATAILDRIAAPVLLIEGGESPAIIGAIQGALSARFAGAARVVVPGAGHMVPLTHPSDVARAMAGHWGVAVVE